MITTVQSTSGHEYTIDTDQLTCTCADFRYRRRYHTMDDEERLCKHLAEFLRVHPEAKPIQLIKADQAMAAQTKSEDGKVRYPRVMFDPYVSAIRKALGQFPEVIKYELCGSYRRQCQMVSDLDILLVLDNDCTAEALFNYCENFLGYVRQWRGDIKAGYLVDGFVHIDFKVVPKPSWSFSLCHFTGSKMENIRLRRRANDMGYKLNEYGLFDQNNNAIPQDFNSEEDIYEFLRLPYKHPWER